jgi:hypothetical protein
MKRMKNVEVALKGMSIALSARGITMTSAGGRIILTEDGIYIDAPVKLSKAAKS